MMKTLFLLLPIVFGFNWLAAQEYAQEKAMRA